VTAQRSLGLALLFACSIAAAACSGASASSVLTPTTQGSSPLRLASPPSLNLPGDVFRLPLTNDPSSSDIGTAAVWSSSAPLVADVTAGTVRALSPGEAEIRASYLGVIAKMVVNVSPLMSLDGIVHETSPREATAIGDALITVIGGRFDGRQTRTASDGRFRLLDIAGVVRVRVVHEGFQS
jgi:hypothetical protein